MFYSQFILAKKGPLGTIWIAAHLERKLRKNQVADTDIGVSVDSILFPDVPIALRLSSHLLLGVVRIYSKKVNYLFDDCSDALLKIKQAFRSTTVDLPPEESTAPYHSITLPETFDLDDFELPDNEMLEGNYVDHHISTRDQITLQDKMEGVDYSTSQFGLDEGFGDGDASQIGLILDEDMFIDRVAAPGYDGLSSSRDVLATVQPATPLKIDEINEATTETSDTILDDDNMKQIQGFSVSTDVVEFADAPSTPGLVGEPVLTNDIEGLGIDDNLVPINLNSSVLTVEEKFENITSDLDFHLENRHDVCSTRNDLILGDVPNPLKDNCCVFSQHQIKHAKPQEGLPHPVEKFDLQSSSEPDMLLTNFTHAESERFQETKLPEIVAPSVAGCESSLKPSSDTEITCQGINAIGVFEQVLEEAKEPQASACEEPKDSRIIENTSFGELASSTTMHLLQPCRSNVSELNVLSENVDVSFMVPEVQGRGADLKFETIPCEYTQADRSNLDDQLVNGIPGNAQIENLEKIAYPYLPAPEKFSLVPDVTENIVDNLFLESTVDKARKEDERECTSILGQKRSLAESCLTMEIHNPEEPFNLLQSKKTADSIPNDDDLLSSILVGRSSVLKIKPTPLPAIAPMKRLCSGPRMSTSKRKVLMDDSMILHGDIIRQQLMSTEDIRRVRKKAPCTRPEIWMIEKQFFDDGIFSEPIFSGMSLKLIFLHRGIHNLTGINNSDRLENVASVKVTKDVSLGNTREFDCNEDTGTPIVRFDENESPVGTPLVGENDHFFTGTLDLTGINNSNTDANNVSVNATMDSPLMNSVEFDDNENNEMSIARNDEKESFLDTPLEGEIRQTEDHVFDSFQLKASIVGPEYRASQNEALHVIGMNGADPATSEIANYEVTPGTDEFPSTIPFKGDCSDMTAGIEIQSTLSDKTNGVASFLSPGTTMNEQSINRISSNAETDANKIDVVENECRSVEDGTHAHCESVSNVNSFAISCQSNGERNDTNGLNASLLSHDDKIQLDIMSEKIFGDAELNFQYNNVKFCDADVEEPKMDASYSSLELEESMRKCSINDEETMCIVDAAPQYNMDVRNTMSDLLTVEDHGESENITAEHDTGFLNVDDDDDPMEDNYIPSTEEAEFFENSGWSSRTRAVAKYLQSQFDRESKIEKKVLPMDNLVAGKSRKEASRMFFETLVLKTRDYIDVDQSNAFSDIHIKPGIKLLKSSF